MLALLYLLSAAAAQSEPAQADLAPASPQPIMQTHNCVSAYPPKSIRLHEEGDVQLQFTIATDGTVRNVSVTKSSGYDELDQAAATCVAQWRYTPAVQNGAPVEASWQTAIKYRVNPSPPPSFLPRRKIERDAYRCIGASIPVRDEKQITIYGTGIDITLQAGVITDVKMYESSGNEALDALALQCFRSVKIGPDDAKKIASEPTFRFVIIWDPTVIRTLANQALPESR